jgi:hypothetical protein
MEIQDRPCARVIASAEANSHVNRRIKTFHINSGTVDCQSLFFVASSGPNLRIILYADIKRRDQRQTSRCWPVKASGSPVRVALIVNILSFA